MLIYRLISTVSLISLLFLIVWFGESTWAKIFLLGSAGFFLLMALHEFFQLSKKMGYKGFPFLTYVCSILLLLSTILEFPRQLEHKNGIISIMLLLIGGIIAILQTGRFAEDWTKRLFPSISAFLFSSLAPVFPADDFLYAGKTALIYFLFVVLVVKFADIGGYVTGRLMSKRPRGVHKLVPTISPEKSWEGLGGSLLFSVITAYLFWRLSDSLFGKQEILMILILTVGLVFLGLLGDLAGSALKRGAKSKDSGKGIPGIGGFIDFLDSLIFVSPLFYYYLGVIA